MLPAKDFLLFQNQLLVGMRQICSRLQQILCLDTTTMQILICILLVVCYPFLGSNNQNRYHGIVMLWVTSYTDQFSQSFSAQGIRERNPSSTPLKPSHPTIFPDYRESILKEPEKVWQEPTDQPNSKKAGVKNRAKKHATAALDAKVDLVLTQQQNRDSFLKNMQHVLTGVQNKIAVMVDSMDQYPDLFKSLQDQLNGVQNKLDGVQNKTTVILDNLNGSETLHKKMTTVDDKATVILDSLNGENKILHEKINAVQDKTNVILENLNGVKQEVITSTDQKNETFRNGMNKIRSQKNVQLGIMPEEFHNCLKIIELDKQNRHQAPEQQIRVRNQKRLEIHDFNTSRNRMAIWWLYFSGIRVSNLLNITYQNLDDIFASVKTDAGFKDTQTQLLLTEKPRSQKMQKVEISKFVHQKYTHGTYNLYADYQKLKEHQAKWYADYQKSQVAPAKKPEQLHFFADFHHLARSANRSHLNGIINNIVQRPEVSVLKKGSPRELSSHSFRINFISHILCFFNLETAQQFANHGTVLTNSQYKNSEMTIQDHQDHFVKITEHLANYDPNKNEYTHPNWQDYRNRAVLIEQNKHAIFFLKNQKPK